MNLHELATPCALVDLDLVECNAARMASRAHDLGVRLRPHVKTHKCLEAARLQAGDHFGGITVSTIAEARFFADGGFRDITYAVPVAPARLAEVVELARALDRFAVLVDHPEAVAEVERCARQAAMRLEVFLKVDCGAGRAGVDPSSPASVALAERLHGSPDLVFRGLLTHAGHAYACHNREEALAVAREERDVLVGLAETLRQRGIPVPELSLGSTPTLMAVDHLDGISEARPGNYVFFDAFQTAIGSCTLDDVAFSVLATVIGVYPQRGELLVNAGATAMSKDPGPVHVDPHCGYGVVLSADGSARHDGLKVISLSQEHGLLRATRGFDVTAMGIGSNLRIVPNHSCSAAAGFGVYHVVRGVRVVDRWHPVRGW